MRNVVTPLRVVSYPHLSYLPQIVAEHFGLYAREGLDVEFLYTENRPAGERLNDALASDEVDLVVGNIWESLRSWGTACEIVPVAHMTQQTRWIVVGRDPSGDATDGWERLQGQRLVLPGDTPTLAVAFREAIRRQGLAPDAFDLVMDPRTRQEIQEDFDGGTEEFVVTDVETAVLAGAHEVAAIADHLGPVPWSVFMTHRGKADALCRELTSFRRALARALAWIGQHEAPEIAACVQHRFPRFSTDETVRMVQRYKMLGTGEWAESPGFEEANVSAWQDALVRWGLLERPAPLDEVLAFDRLLRRDSDRGEGELRGSWQQTGAELGSAR